jgi:hypothetical protein
MIKPLRVFRMKTGTMLKRAILSFPFRALS